MSGAHRDGAVSSERIRIVPANETSWADLDAIYGHSDYPSRCLCQRFKVTGWLWRDTTIDERVEMAQLGAACDEPESACTSGLVAFVDEAPAAFVAVEPRVVYPKLRGSRVPWTGRNENKDDPGVWSITCFTVRKGYRGRGLTYPLAVAAAEFARERGASAVEAYPMITHPGEEITWGELFVGARQVFADAGFAEISHPTKRRVVMRIDF